jgi:hypothetical protein
MRIPPTPPRSAHIPIQFFWKRTTKTKSSKRSSKASSSSKSRISTDVGKSIDVVDPADFMDGDADTMQSTWEDVDRFFETENGKEDPSVNFRSILVDAKWISNSYQNEIRNQGKWFEKAKIPLHHVTLYEAIIYDELIHHRLKEIPSRVTVRPIVQYIQNKIVFLFELYDENKSIECYQIRYDFMSHKSIITNRAHQKIGWFDIIVRQNRLEEIQGELHGMPLLLDPIWADDFTVKSETLRFGGSRAEVFKSKQSTQISVLDQQGRRVPFSMKNVNSVFLKKGIFLTRKTVTIGRYRLSINQLFLMQLLIPFRFNVTILSS